MSRVLITAAVLLCLSQASLGQDFRDDLRFAEALRDRGDLDLALELLNRLDKNATPEQKKELPLEFAKTRLRLAADEPDTAKRLALYREARSNFETFIGGNPGHPRLPEANLEVARVLNAQGKTELGQALLNDDGKTKGALAAQSRATLVEALNRLKVAEKELAGALKALPDPDGIEDPTKKKLASQAIFRAEQEVKQARFEMGMNLYDQSETYLGGSDEKASELLLAAKAILDPLAAGETNSSVTWKAMAWVGRIIAQIEKAEDGRAKFTQVLNGVKFPAAFDGIRLARYFRLLVIEKSPDQADLKRPGGIPGIIIESGERWLTDYTRYQKTPEGYGLKFLLATTYLAQSDGNKKIDETVRNRYRTRARALLRDVENSENEFTDRAKQMKIRVMRAQGGFRRDIATLKTFEDCYVRAQYESSRLNVDALADRKEELKALPDPETLTTPAEKKAAATARAAVEAEIKKLSEPGALEKERQSRITAIKESLRRGLAMPEVKTMKASTELANARMWLTFWSLQSGDLDEAIRVGEEFIRNDPRSAQAGLTALSVLQAYSQQIDAKRAKFDEKEMADLRNRLFSVVTYVEDRWGNDSAGNMARHTLGLQLMKEENFPEAIRKLSLVTPTYHSYALVCLQLADLCKKAEKAGSEPIIGDRDTKDYRKRAILALERLPVEGLGPDPFTNQVTIAGKVQLLRDMFAYRRYERMDTMTTQLLPLVDKLRFNDEEDKHKTIKEQLKFDLTDLNLYAKYGMADAAFVAGEHAKAGSLLDPLVDVLSKKEDSQEKLNLQKNKRLASGILTVALKANLQQGKIDRTDLVLESLEQVTGDGEDASSGTGTLQLLAFLIRGQVDELRKKGDKSELEKAIKGYSEILTKRTAKLKKTPDLIRALAACYSSMEQHEKSADQLKDVPFNEMDPGSKAIRLMYVRELRMSKTPDNLKKAREVMTEIIGAPGGKPGWGARDLTARLESGLLLHEEGKWAEAFGGWVNLVKALGPQVSKGGAVRDRYFEVYFYMILSSVKLGQTKVAAEERDKAMENAARQIISLETSWPDLGGDVSKARFADLLTTESALKAKYEELKKKGK